MITDKQREICESLDWRVTEYDGYAELEKYSSEGEDFIMTVETKDFVNAVQEYYNDFDPDKHAEDNIVAKHAGASGMPSCMAICADAEFIDSMIEELLIALCHPEDCS